jgi:hypothetical protein
MTNEFLYRFQIKRAEARPDNNLYVTNDTPLLARLLLRSIDYGAEHRFQA